MCERRNEVLLGKGGGGDLGALGSRGTQTVLGQHINLQCTEPGPPDHQIESNRLALIIARIIWPDLSFGIAFAFVNDS